MNLAFVNDERVENAAKQIMDEFLDWNKRCQIYKDITPYILENTWYIPIPSSRKYTAWQPWTKNYHGEWSVGSNQEPNYVKWVWIDQNLKENMTGTR